jgi:hypothetical protein
VRPPILPIGGEPPPALQTGERKTVAKVVCKLGLPETLGRTIRRITLASVKNGCALWTKRNRSGSAVARMNALAGESYRVSAGMRHPEERLAVMWRLISAALSRCRFFEWPRPPFGVIRPRNLLI